MYLKPVQAPEEWGGGLNVRQNMAYHATFVVDDRDMSFTPEDDSRWDMTTFFRYHDTGGLPERIAQHAIERASPGQPIRVLSLPSSIGCEAYTLSAIFKEEARKQKRDIPVEIHMADISQKKLNAAATGVYPAGFYKAIPNEYRHRYFSLQGDFMAVNDDVKSQVKALPAFNVLEAPAMAIPYDVVMSFNMLCYLPGTPERVAAADYLGSLARQTLWLSHGARQSYKESQDAVEQALAKRSYARVRDFKSGPIFIAQMFDR